MTDRRVTHGSPPVRRMLRNAELATLPVAYSGRRAAGVGKRALGRSAAEVDHEIRARTAEHMFEVLGELKGCAAKLGQLFAIYQLALPNELADPYRKALARLHDSAPIMLPSTVHTVMSDQFGTDWHKNFRKFDDRRAAAASLGQVHRAVWHDGRSVAVKVMYPGAREAVESDLAQLRSFSSVAPAFLPGADVRALTEALCESVRDELDYADEARYQRVFADAYAGSDDCHVPAVVEQRGDVLVTEWLDGTPMSRIIDKGSPAQRDRLGVLMARFVLSGWEQHGLLYCDPHPGNFRLLDDGRLGVVDFGACTPWPAPGFTDLAVELCDAIFNGGPAELEAAIRKHGFVAPGHNFDSTALDTTLNACSEPLRHNRFQITTRWLRSQVLHAANPSLSNVLRELTMPAWCTPFARAALTMIGTLSQLETESTYADELVHCVPALQPVFQNSGTGTQLAGGQ